MRSLFVPKAVEPCRRTPVIAGVSDAKAPERRHVGPGWRRASGELVSQMAGRGGYRTRLTE
jgi:hypothetical protein